MNLNESTVIKVCDKCLRACCWQGQFMCDKARDAGVKRLTIKQLRAGRYGEAEDWWDIDPSTGCAKRC